MAYAASLGDTLPQYFDTAGQDVVAHPLFTVCPEWPVLVSGRSNSQQAGVSPAEVRASVHATHDVVIHRLVRPGDVLTTSLTTTGVVNIRPGAKATSRLETIDADGKPVASTVQDGIYLGFEATGPDAPDPDPRPPIAGTDRRGEPDELRIALPAGAAHTYTECARIWNPIHTDRAIALAAGLPDIILHGTANLAYGVSAVVARRADQRPELVRRLSCRFAAMVELPSTITVRIWEANDQSDGTVTVPFEVLNEAGAPAVKDGLAVLGEPAIEV